MAEGVVAVAIIAIALGIGALAYGHAGDASHALSDAMALLSAIFYVAVGLAFILGGYTAIGLMFIALFTFIGLGKADRLSDRDIRGKING